MMPTVIRLCRDVRTHWKYFRDVIAPGGPSTERNQHCTGTFSSRNQRNKMGPESPLHRDIFHPGSTKHPQKWMYIPLWALQHMERNERLLEIFPGCNCSGNDITGTSSGLHRDVMALEGYPRNGARAALHRDVGCYVDHRIRGG
jgi:hypothetical protein